MNWKILLRRVAKQFVGTVVLFSAFVSATTVLWMLLANCVGYLPYSDRPGVGWRLAAHWPSIAEVGSYLGFIPLFCLQLLAFGGCFFVLVLILGIISSPRWACRLIGGVLGVAMSWIGVAAAGWYIALSPVGPESAAIAGLIYGVAFFPRLVVPREKRPPLLIRVISAIVLPALVLLWVIWPLLPKTPIPRLSYSVVRITPGPRSVVEQLQPGDRQVIGAFLEPLHLTGEMHGGIGGTASGDDKVPSIQANFYLMEPIKVEVDLPMPKTGAVVYVLQSGHWSSEPSNFVHGKQILHIRPLQSHMGREGMNEGAEVRLSDEKFYPFHFYPVIPDKQ